MNDTGFVVLKVHLEIIDCVKMPMTEPNYGTPRLINRSHHNWAGRHATFPHATST